MLADFSLVLASYGQSYNKVTSSKFEYNGITYDDTSSSTIIIGVMTPLTSEDREEVLKLGHSLVGKMTFYVGGSESVLTENDIIVDSNDVEWAVLPVTADWMEHGNYRKYTLNRKVLSEG